MAITPFQYLARLSCLPVAALLLTACGTTDIKEELGLTHRSPDEFQVYSRPALSVPPEFDLRPPGQGSPYVAAKPADEQAHSEILGIDSSGTLSTQPDTQAMGEQQQHFLTAPSTAVAPVSASTLPSSSDAQFLTDVGAQKADPHIRQELLDDKFVAATPKKSSYLFGWGGDDTPSTVDAAKEADRIKQDKAQNQPVTTGDTPVVTPPDKGILSSLGSIF